MAQCQHLQDRLHLTVVVKVDDNINTISIRKVYKKLMLNHNNIQMNITDCYKQEKGCS